MSIVLKWQLDLCCIHFQCDQTPTSLAFPHQIWRKQIAEVADSRLAHWKTPQTGTVCMMATEEGGNHKQQEDAEQ